MTRKLDDKSTTLNNMTQKQIAIVNTNKNTPSALKSLLSDLGYGVECYTQVSTLIEITKTHPTDVIIIESDIANDAGLNLVKTFNQLVTLYRQYY